MSYNHKEIEKKWQKYWDENKIFHTPNPGDPDFDESKPKYYVLDMFPYPSGAGLHVGHPEGYTANDIIARYKHAKGYNVLHPMGWDAFGLPAENYAIKTGTHPRITTEKNIATFKKQIKSLGFSYDWNREINTTDPNYFKWTQWIFLKLFEHGLAYEQDLPINYCPSCKTGLANEEVLNDGTCERCGTKVIKKPIRQWVLAITKYADRLARDVDKLDWPEGIKEMQKNWIGRSEGTQFKMNVVKNIKENKNRKRSEDIKYKKIGEIEVYTTRIDTVFGMTYAVIAPDHPEVEKFITEEQKKVCEKYIEDAKSKSDLDRTAENKEKTGVWTGSYVINPFNNEKVPLWIADYVLGHYGTGAVMAVPAHDERDFAFAKKYNLPIKEVVVPFFTTNKGSDAPRKDKKDEERELINVILKDPKTNKVLCLDWKQTGWKSFVSGGTDGESLEIAMKREILEESGYKNVKLVKILGQERVYFYTPHKDVNRKGKVFGVYAELIDNEQIKVEKNELEKHKPVWVDFNKVGDFINLDSHRYFLEKLIEEKPFTEYGVLINSGKFSGLSSQEAKEILTKYAEEKGFGQKKVNYKLRDWLFSRQRYWGEPIPLIHLKDDDLEKIPHISSIDEVSNKNIAYILKKEDGQYLVINGEVFSKIYDGLYTKIICDYNLPVKLPDIEKYEPAGDGQGPLARIDNWINVKLAENLQGKRETNTMPQWAGSCWYYLRFMDPKNDQQLVAPEVEKYFGQVDSYVGGAEHAVLHLLYARFWHKFLYDINVVSHDEPFKRLRNQGLILAYAYQRKNGGLVPTDMVEERDGKYYHKETGEELEKVIAKMSKSLKNVINPDEIIDQYGADALRLYEMYMADFKDSAPWDTKGIIGVKRFLDKVARLFMDEIGGGDYQIKSDEKKNNISDEEKMRLLHKSIKKISQDIENYKFNTAIAQLMILLKGGVPQDEKLANEWKLTFIKLLHPFAPHISEEIYQHYLDVENKKTSIFFELWPEYDEKLAEDNVINIAIQVMGKLRATIQVSVDTPKEEILQKAKSEPNVARWLEGKTIVKEIYVPGKIINFVIR